MTQENPSPSTGDPSGVPDRDGDILRQTNLTKNQLLLWLEQMIHPEAPLYNMVMAYTINGEIDHAHFQSAFQALVDGTDALRLVIHEEDGIPRLHVLPSMNAPVEYVDLSGTTEPREAYDLWWKKRCVVPFDLRKRLFDSVLLRIGASEYVWFFVQHHLITDSFSTMLAFRRMATLYGKTRRGGPGKENLKFAPFEEYRSAEAGYRTSAEYAHSGSYWRKKLAGLPPPMTYYSQATRGSVSPFCRVRRNIGVERTRRLRELAGRDDIAAVSPDLTILNLFGATLFAYMSRVSGNRRLAIGVPIRNRTTPGLNETYGLLMEVAPVIVDLGEEETFASLIRKMTVEMYEVLQHYRFGTGNAVHGKIYDVMLNYHPWTYPEFDGKPVRVEWPISGHSTGGLNLQVHSFDGSEDLAIEFDCNQDVFDEESRLRAIEHFFLLLDACLDDASQVIDRVPLLTRGEQVRIVDQWNRTEKDYGREKRIHELIEECAGRFPEKDALTFGDTRLSYRELSRRSNQLARYLRHRGVGPETLVGVCVERSPDMVVGVLGVWKAGGAYVPLDPAYPPARLMHMVQDAGISILMTQERLRTAIPGFGGRMLMLDTQWEEIGREPDGFPDSAVTENTLAYVIYTSGSTGTPKGVMIEHRGIVNLAFGMNNELRIDTSSRVLQFSSFSFDAWVPEVVSALVAGGTLCLAAADEILPGGPLEAFIGREQVTVATFPPSVLAMMSPEDVPSLRTVVSAGERCTKESVARWSGSTRFFNGYGPTEATVCTTLAQCDPTTDVVSIGKPFVNVQAFVADRFLNLQPIGVPGELCVAGVNVGRGYLGKPDLSADRFPASPFPGSMSDRIYRTGDLVRYLPDGNLEFLGRIDQQVKLRGFRIELGEIEAALSRHPSIQHCAVILREDTPGDKRLVAYAVPHAGANPDVQDIRDQIKTRLPDYMIPSGFVFLKAFPVTPNGKIDKNALPVPEASALVGVREYEPPQTDHERAVAAVFADVLRLPRVGRHDNFFEIGGQSLLAMQVIARIRSSLNVDIRVQHLFDNPSVSSLAGIVATAATAPQETKAAPGSPPPVDVDSLSDEEVDRMLSQLLKKEGGKS